MTRVSSSFQTRCPYVRAVSYLDRYLRELPCSEGGSERVLRLRAPLAALGLPGNTAIDRDVVASFGELENAHGLQYGKVVTWRPEGGGPFPIFRGTLSISAATPKSSIMALAGEYEPPLGIFGKGFDAAVGRKIAEATAAELLLAIREWIERTYMLDEPHLSR